MNEQLPSHTITDRRSTAPEAMGNRSPSAKPGSSIGHTRAERAAAADLVAKLTRAGMSAHIEIGDPKPPGSSVFIAEDMLVAKHFDDLVTAKEMEQLNALAAAVKKERDFMDEHNTVLIQERIGKAVDAYAKDPTPANHKTLRDLKALDPHECYIICEHARQRVDKLFDAACPLFAAITTRARDFILATADRLASEDAARYAEFCLAPVTSPLESALRNFASLWSTELIALNNGKSAHEFSRLIEAIVKFPARQAAETERQQKAKAQKLDTAKAALKKASDELAEHDKAAKPPRNQLGNA